MRSFRHWSVRYIFNRINELMYRKVSPHTPWFTPLANQILEQWLRDSDVGLEYGSGGSTLWFAKRVRSLTSVEHHQGWYEKVSQRLKQQNLSNVTYLFFPQEQATEYVHVFAKFSKNSLDFVVVDGIERDVCANAVLDYLRPGGILIIDNVNWFLPSDTFSPDSRTHTLGPVSPEWAKFLLAVKGWRCLWTTSGVTDTAIYIKP